MKKSAVLLLELNEVSFDLIRRYVSDGHLPAFGELIARHGVAETLSETRYEELEPWIQWVTAHTGLTFAQHGVFRLGDGAHSDHEQIWERLEGQGLSVGALSPMNAKHRLKAPAFFLPDPWTDTAISAPFLARRLHRAICQAVNDNATAKITFSSLFWLLLGLVRFAAPANYLAYLRLASTSLRRHWNKAAFLDLLISDLFNHLAKNRQVDFASLFLNAAAHVQHHYMHSSSVLQTDLRNPEWYCASGEDPVLAIYETYDRILSQVRRRFPDHRLMIATGLHQEPHEAAIFYWRLRNHGDFVRRLGLDPVAVRPRMSRDFLLEFASPDAALSAATVLEAVTDPQGQPLLEVDNRGPDLFVTFAYPNDIPSDFTYRSGNKTFHRLRDQVAFVAIKNGAHDGTGYLLDTGTDGSVAQARLSLTELPDRICEALGVPSSTRRPERAA